MYCATEKGNAPNPLSRLAGLSLGLLVTGTIEKHQSTTFSGVVIFSIGKTAGAEVWWFPSLFVPHLPVVRFMHLRFYDPFIVAAAAAH